MENKQYIYKGKKRPFIYISNFGNVYLEKGDVIKYNEKYVYIDRIFNYPDYHRHLTHLSNFIPLKNHFQSTNLNDIEYFESILKGVNKTPLELQNEKILKLSKLVPKSNFNLAKYNFSNNFRPVYQYEYKNGKYYGSNVEGGSDIDVAWYMYRNLFIVIPSETTEINAKDFNEIYEKQFNFE
jgi:hypothetical protein